MSGCPHEVWHHPPGPPTPLLCAACGVLWPGEPLPTPAHQRQGYGDLANLPTWRSRVDRMTAALAELDEP